MGVREKAAVQRRPKRWTALSAVQCMILAFLIVTWTISFRLADMEAQLDLLRGSFPGGERPQAKGRRERQQQASVPRGSDATAAIPSANGPSYVPGRHLDDAELRLDGHLLTIAVDRRHSCPDNCVFAHVVLPPWVRYRYIDFDTEVDLAKMLSDYDGHVLIVARTNIINIAAWGVERRRLGATANKTVSTGLWHMSDERIYGGEIKNVYHKFDYVIRHYWWLDDHAKIHNYTLHALGNYTCGTKPQTLPLAKNDYGPRWGLHYALLNAHGIDVQLQRYPTSTWPIKQRSTNCSFIGRSDVKRSHKERSTMKTAIETHAPDLNCTIAFTNGFSLGNGKFQYLNYDLVGTKIGLSPRGSAIETHRLTELLRTGTVPAIVDEPYLHAMFANVPGIIGATWDETAKLMVEAIAEERGGGKRLEELSRRGAKFYRDLEACMTEDMNFILRGAFGLTN